MSSQLDCFKVEVLPHDRTWRVAFEIDSKQIALALSENAIALHHIGSMVILQIYAKPIIDILVEVKNFAKIDAPSSAHYNIQRYMDGKDGFIKEIDRKAAQWRSSN
ncbi:MAG: GrpB family protein [Oscillatoriaceae cyanobacterium Prado104]|jgi:GrpB-like predicted nucleotidyltransferase (UPF0157 family)|nr:GrpB family protein [Oscillatoriaceae cyanobacterium Prado104]